MSTGLTAAVVQPRHRQRWWRRFPALSLRALLTVLIVAMVGSLGLALLRISYTTLRDSKTRDVWAIYFLEMESQAKRIADQLLPRRLPDATSAAGTTASLDLVSPRTYEIRADGQLLLVAGAPIAGLRTLTDLGINAAAELTRWNLVWLEAHPYVALRLAATPAEGNVDSGRLVVAPFARRVTLNSAGERLTQSLVYIATRQGRLVYSNSPVVNQATFAARPLVQRFIEMPIPQGQIELEDRGGHQFYGFFMEIPETNLVIWAETAKDLVTRDVARTTRHLLYVILALVGGVSLVLFLILTLLLRPIARVAALALTVAKGNLDVAVTPTSFGEVRQLTEAFRTMIAGLKQRDKVIHDLMQEQETRIRLESELALAKSIQENLLTMPTVSPTSGVQLAARYAPASEVAGDWYGSFYDEALHATVVAVVDISGHGVGSSMFTAITAAIFEEYRRDFAAAPEPRRFLERLHAQLRRYGQETWYATGIIAVLWPKAGRIDMVNAGHPRPLLSALNGREFHGLKQPPSTPLGLKDQLQLAESATAIGPNQMLVLYTDGLTEWRSTEHRALTTQGVVRALSRSAATTPTAVIDVAFEAARIRAGAAPQTDDICIVVTKVS